MLRFATYQHPSWSGVAENHLITWRLFEDSVLFGNKSVISELALVTLVTVTEHSLGRL